MKVKVDNIFTTASKINIIGDSHIRPLKFVKFCQIKVISGATMSGIMNPNSKTKSHEIIKSHIMNISSNSILLLSLGEVDAGYLSIIKSSNDYDQSKLYIKKAVDRYFDFYQEIINLRSDIDIYITNILPTYMDEKRIAKSKIKDRRNIRLDFNHRQKLIDYSNNYLEEKFSKVIDINKQFKKLGMVYQSKHINRKDHHYNSYFYVVCFCSAIGIYSSFGLQLKIKCFFYDLMSFIK